MIKVTILVLVLLAFVWVNPTLLYSENESLPAGLTDSERLVVKEYVKKQLDESSFTAGITPDGSFYAPAEFEPADAVLYSWSGYSTLLTKLIKESCLDNKVILICSSSYSKSSAERTLKGAGVDMANLSFLVAPTNSVWIRDFGPMFVLDDKGDRGVLDLIYNRPRPNDDKIPQKVAEHCGFNYYKPSLILPGGNLIIDGKGTAFMTDVVFDSSEGGDPSMTHAKIEKIFNNFYNVERVVIIPKMNRDGTGHIDMFCKLLPGNVFIVGEYASPSDGASGNYDILNKNAETLAGMKDLDGNSYKVVRIPMPKYTGTSFSYTNSLILNKTVLVPIYGKSFDDTALKIYRDNMPGYKVVGFDCSRIITANGAIHCISKLVMGPQIKVDVIGGTENVQYSPTKISARISSYREIREAKLYWRTGSENQVRFVSLEDRGNDLYEAVIPPDADPSEIMIYIKDERGMKKIVKL
ncbi:agmatine deiminase family protein [bacterium]|nr:agmatine deiminase family protein [bacterium]